MFSFLETNLCYGHLQVFGGSLWHLGGIWPWLPWRSGVWRAYTNRSQKGQPLCCMAALCWGSCIERTGNCLMSEDADLIHDMMKSGWVAIEYGEKEKQKYCQENNFLAIFDWEVIARIWTLEVVYQLYEMYSWGLLGACSLYSTCGECPSLSTHRLWWRLQPVHGGCIQFATWSHRPAEVWSSVWYSTRFVYWLFCLLYKTVCMWFFYWLQKALVLCCLCKSWCYLDILIICRLVRCCVTSSNYCLTDWYV